MSEIDFFGDERVEVFYSIPVLRAEYIKNFFLVLCLVVVNVPRLIVGRYNIWVGRRQASSGGPCICAGPHTELVYSRVLN